MNYAIVVVVILVLVYIYTRREAFTVSPIDNRAYSVVERYDNHDLAANTLARINQANIKLIQHMQHKYMQPARAGSWGRVLSERLTARYQPDALIENDPPDKDNTSYTENKGDVVAMCLREKTTGRDEIENWNSLMFVSIHELGHIASETYGHDVTFWSNFKFLIIEAREAGVLDVIDYSRAPINYCGLDVTYNPAFDTSLH